MVLTSLQKGLGLAGILGFLGLLSMKARAEEKTKEEEFRDCVGLILPIPGDCCLRNPDTGEIKHFRSMQECDCAYILGFTETVSIELCPPLPVCVEGETETIICDDISSPDYGKTFITKECINGEWVTYDIPRSWCMPTYCTAGEKQYITCNDINSPDYGNQIAVKECVNGIWENLPIPISWCGSPSPECTEEQKEYTTCEDTESPDYGKITLIRRCIYGEWKDVSLPINWCTSTPSQCIEGESYVVESCPSLPGAVHIWRKCVNGEWVEYVETCPLPPVCSEGAEEVVDLCPEGGIHTWRECISGQWIYHTNTCLPSETVTFTGNVRARAPCPPHGMVGELLEGALITLTPSDPSLPSYSIITHMPNMPGYFELHNIIKSDVPYEVTVSKTGFYTLTDTVIFNQDVRNKVYSMLREVCITTDKPVYAPGESVHVVVYIVYMGIGEPVVGFQIQDPDGMNVFVDSVEFSDPGGYASIPCQTSFPTLNMYRCYYTKYVLPSSTKPGQYTIYAAGGGANVAGTKTFEVT